MSTQVDNLSATWRCKCGSLYTDYTGLAGQCHHCRDKIRKEMEQQKANSPGDVRSE